jgi:hypothetical protein
MPALARSALVAVHVRLLSLGCVGAPSDRRRMWYALRRGHAMREFITIVLPIGVILFLLV